MFRSETIDRCKDVVFVCHGLALLPLKTLAFGVLIQTIPAKAELFLCSILTSLLVFSWLDRKMFSLVGQVK